MFRVQGLGFEGAGCWVQGAGCRVQGAGCRVQGADLLLGFGLFLVTLIGHVPGDLLVLLVQPRDQLVPVENLDVEDLNVLLESGDRGLKIAV
jgi:hypothetical protein